MEKSLNKTPSLGLSHPESDPQLILEQWHHEARMSHSFNKDPADVLMAEQDRQERLAALESFMTLDKLSGNKYAKGLRYLFAIHVDGKSPEAVARMENTSADKIQKAVKDTCEVLRPVLARLMPLK